MTANTVIVAAGSLTSAAKRSNWHDVVNVLVRGEGHLWLLDDPGGDVSR